MKKVWKRIIIVVVVLLLTAPFVFDSITVRALEWQDIQRYGGIQVGQPVDTEHGFYLPIVFNTAGDSITLRPVETSDVYVCKRTVVKKKDRNIYISVKRSWPFFDDESCNCKATKLGSLEPGHYKVYYDSGEFIGEFDIR